MEIIVKAQIARNHCATEIKFSSVQPNHWFLYEGELHIKTDLVDEYDAVYFSCDGDIDAKSIGKNELVTPVNVTISY